jgi:hypothetical protein
LVVGEDEDEVGRALSGAASCQMKAQRRSKEPDAMPHAAPQTTKTNIEHRTTLAASVGHSVFDVRCSMFDLRLRSSLNSTPHFLASAML